VSGVTQDNLWADLKTGDVALIASKYGSVMGALSHALRGAIIADPGKQLFVSDFSAIEARVVMWLANQTDALNIFRQGKDIYLDMAATIYRRVCTKKDVKERQLSKAVVLACGFGMGASKFVNTAATYGITIDEDFSQQVVNAYRAKYARVKAMWYAQEDAAIRCVKIGHSVQCDKIGWLYEGRFLYAVLPSGRRLSYPDPEIHVRQTPWGEPKPSLTFMGVDAHTRQWKRQHTYGGSIVENQCQAVARDLLAEAIVRCENGGFPVVMTCHDEIVSEGSMAGDLQEFEALVTECPQWATGLPIAAESFKAFRYRKG
jgi:DNA polymerase